MRIITHITVKKDTTNRITRDLNILNVEVSDTRPDGALIIKYYVYRLRRLKSKLKRKRKRKKCSPWALSRSGTV